MRPSKPTKTNKGQQRPRRKTLAYLVHKSDGRALEGVLLGQVDAHFPDAALVGRPLGSAELDDELVEAAEDRDLVLRLDQLDHVRVHATFPGRRRTHL